MVNLGTIPVGTAARVVFTVKLPASLADRVRERARQTGVTISALVAQALTEFLGRRRARANTKPAPRSRRERTDRQPGGQPGHPGATLGQVATPAERVRHRPEVCAGCGTALAEASVVSTENRHGQSAFGVIRMLHADNPWMPVTA